VVLISIDALRADRLGCYGHDRPTTPFLDSLAASGERFDRAFVVTHGTTPSHASLLSGQYQETHRVGWVEGAAETAGDGGAVAAAGVPAGIPWLPEALRARGWRTLGVTDGGNVGARFGFGRGFEVYDDRGGGVEKVVRRALRQLSDGGDDGRPTFLFLHTYEVHSPYTPPAAWAQRFGSLPSDFVPTSANLLAHVHTAATTLSEADRAAIGAAYDAELAYTDHALGGLFEALGGRRFLERTLVVVTADHGEELGDHGGLLHRDLLYDELLRVPLIVAGPGLGRGETVGALVEEVDLAPSILAYLGLPTPAGMEGRPVFGQGYGAGNRPAVFAQYGGRRYAVRTPSWKLIANRVPAGESPARPAGIDGDGEPRSADESAGEPAAGGREPGEPGSTVPRWRYELYDLETDPGEHRDLAAERPDQVERLAEALERWRSRRAPGAEPGEPVDLDREEIERLKALGYLGGS
jgi:arylsulfatase A-like enzyme